MGFWDWLTGTPPRVTVADRVWLTGTAKRRGLCRQVQEYRADDRSVLVLAHFPATLAGVAAELAAAGVPHDTSTAPIPPAAADRLTGLSAGDPVRLALVRQLQPDPYPGESASADGLLHVLVAERHFLREADDVVTAFAGGLAVRCHVTFHVSLEDPLMAAFEGDWLRSLLGRLGMDEDSPIESELVARRIRDVQAKFAVRASRDLNADSAEAWLHDTSSD